MREQPTLSNPRPTIVTVDSWRMYISLFVSALVGLILAGCGAGYVTPHDGSITAKQKPPKIQAEAYLYDAKLWRDGKPTTIRLEIFQTDTVMALGGRAYLGKDAFKGRLTDDSLTLYFPTRNEYLHESVEEMILTSNCPVSFAVLNLLDLFTERPDSLSMDDDITIIPDYGNEKRPKFLLFEEGCPWQAALTYDQRRQGWRLREFEFSDGNRLKLKAERREYKARASVKVRKFRVRVPAGTVRVTP